ncbi:MAG TPA: GlxA family transcriptional regulator [Cytophagales bacterium]|nr:GlxA family transcriptional regulator [Cytophagales bacterium]
MEVDISMGKKHILVVAMPHTLLLDVAGPCDVFSRANLMVEKKLGIREGYKISVVSRDSSNIVMSLSGAGLYCKDQIEDIKSHIDTLIIAGNPSTNAWESKPAFLKWMVETYNKSKRIASICVGAFLLAEAGLLTGRSATTHWKFCKELQRRFPDVKVDGDPIYVKDGNIYTSAGVSAGIDLALALVEEDYGREIALEVARDLVLYLRRPGSQSQFSVVLAHQEAEYEPIRKLQTWMLDHLHEDLGVEALANQCFMSPRNFARVFHKEIGLTPGKYLEKLRVERCRRLLEAHALDIDQIANECGFGSADTMRRIFLRNLKVTPSDYRRCFHTALKVASVE